MRNNTIFLIQTSQHQYILLNTLDIYTNVCLILHISPREYYIIILYILNFGITPMNPPKLQKLSYSNHIWWCSAVEVRSGQVTRHSLSTATTASCTTDRWSTGECNRQVALYHKVMIKSFVIWNLIASHYQLLYNNNHNFTFERFAQTIIWCINVGHYILNLE